MPLRRRWQDLLVGSGIIAASMVVMNVATYGFTIVAARMLGPTEYGALAAVMGLLIVLNVLSLGLQATGARRVAADPGSRSRIEAEVRRATYLSAAGIGTLALLATPLVANALDLNSWAVAALLAASSVPLTIMGGHAGIHQGEHRWVPLAMIYLAVGLGRLVFGFGALMVRPDALGAMTGVAIGAMAPALVGWLTTPRDRTTPVSRDETPVDQGVLRETLHNSHALLAFFALSNVDVVAARIVLDAHEAGLYAGGLILTKAVLFLPQFVSVIAFPTMSRPGSTTRLHLAAVGGVLAIGVVTVAGVAALPELALAFVGGAEYAEVADRLWVFACLGTVLAMLQMAVYAVLARQRQRSVFVIWAALAALTVGAGIVEGDLELLLMVVTVDTVLLVVLLVSTMRPERTQATG